MNGTSAVRPFSLAERIAPVSRSCACMSTRPRRVLCQCRHVFVAAARVTDQYSFAGITLRPLFRVRESMRCFQRRQNALCFAEFLQRFERIVVAGGNVVHATGRLQQRVLRTNARIVEARRDRVRFLHLAVVVLQDDGVSTLQYAWRAGRQRRGILAKTVARATRFDTDQFNVVADQRIEQTDRIRATADAGERGIGQSRPPDRASAVVLPRR